MYYSYGTTQTQRHLVRVQAIKKNLLIKGCGTCFARKHLSYFVWDEYL